MIMTVILDKHNRPVLSVSHDNMDKAQTMADGLNEANARLGYNYHAIVEVIH